MALGRKPIEIVESGSHKLLVIADTWERVRLDQVADVRNGFAFKSTYFNHNEGMPLIRIRDISNAQTENLYSGEYEKEYLVERGDILIGMDGDFNCARWIGNTSLLNQRVCKIIPVTGLYLDKFLFLCLQPYLNAINEETSSITVKHLSSRTIQEIPLPLPPINEQHRIVTKIEEIFSELDKGIESLKRAREQLKLYRQALLKHAFEGKLTEQWRKDNADKLETADQLLERIKKEREARYQQQLEEWQAAVKQWEADGKEGRKSRKPKKLQDTNLDQDAASELPTLAGYGTYAPLGDLLDDPKYGTSKKCTYDTNGAGVLRIPNVVSGRVDSTDLKFAEFDDSELSDYALLDGDILLIRSNGSISIVGRVALIEAKDTGYIYAGYLIRLRPNDSLIISKYLLFVLETHMLRKQIEAKAKSTSGVNNINSGEIKSLIVPVTGVEEQSEIVKLLEEKLSVADSSMSDIEDNLIKSEALRQSILKKAFSGQLVPQDPNDEPASVLLERIATEKAEFAAQAKATKAVAKKAKTRQKLKQVRSSA